MLLKVSILFYLHKCYTTSVLESLPGRFFSCSPPVRMYAGVEVLWDKQSAAPLESSLNLQVETLQLAKQSWSNKIYHSGGILCLQRAW